MTSWVPRRHSRISLFTTVSLWADRLYSAAQARRQSFTCADRRARTLGNANSMQKCCETQCVGQLPRLLLLTVRCLTVAMKVSAGLHGLFWDLACLLVSFFVCLPAVCPSACLTPVFARVYSCPHACLLNFWLWLCLFASARVCLCVLLPVCCLSLCLPSCLPAYCVCCCLPTFLCACVRFCLSVCLRLPARCLPLFLSLKWVS